MATIRRHWFLIALVAAVSLALLWPAPGRPVGWWQPAVITKAAIALIFLGSGLTLPADRLRRAGRALPTHLTIQACNLGLLPPLGIALGMAAAAVGLHPALATGLALITCMPTTITSCLIFTGIADGDRETALINAIGGNLLGLAITPLWVLAAIGATTSTDLGSALLTLGSLVLLPMLIGQAWRWRWAAALDQHQGGIGLVGQTCLLTILFLACCTAFADGFPLALDSTILLVLCCVLLRLLLLAITWGLGHLLRWDRPRRIALLFCGSEKTLALGIPMIAILFAGDPNQGLYALPLIVFHPLQLLVDAWLAGQLAPEQHR